MNKRLQKNDSPGGLYSSSTHQEYSRIITAAVINLQFRKLLLSNPANAIDTGYAGEKFRLAYEEKNRVASIKATSLADFAMQLTQALEPAGSLAIASGD